MNKPIHSLIYLILIASLFSCAKEETSNLETPELLPEFEEVLNAHGDWLQWYYAKAESYLMIHESVLIEEDASINLKSRKIRLSNTEFEMGFDSEKTWISPSRRAYGGPSIKFYHNLYFYFYNIPFVFTDPGVKVEQVAERSLNGETYPTLKATFESGTGASSDDEFFMLLNPETNRVEYLLYTVTYFGKNNTKINALKYEDYIDYQGVYFPRILTGYEFENDSLQAIRYQVSFSDLLLSSEEFKNDIFEKPENGIYAD